MIRFEIKTKNKEITMNGWGIVRGHVSEEYAARLKRAFNLEFPADSFSVKFFEQKVVEKEI
jgi:hypothetical protein